MEERLHREEGFYLMWKKVPYRTLIGIWLLWLVITIGYQAAVKMRITDLERPDRVLDWTETETTTTSQNDKPYLIEPFMNNQVAWDSAFYLSIATKGYNDPVVGMFPVTKGVPRPSYSLNYAFFPMYPIFIWLFAWPLKVLGMNAIATATLSGVIVSALGTLLAMIALYCLTTDDEDHDTSLRAVFYLIVFPMGFFLAMVYTEGLFLGLSFACLAAIRNKQWFLAGMLAGLATLTRTLGGALMIPMIWAWMEQKTWQDVFAGGKRTLLGLGKTAMVGLPLMVFGAWRLSHYGEIFMGIEAVAYHRKLLDFPAAMLSWNFIYTQLLTGKPQTQFFYILEIAATILAIAASLWLMRKHPAEALYSLVLIFIPATSGVAQGMPRYVMAIPAIFMLLARLGKRAVFDRAWTMISILLFGVQAMLFAFNFWVN
jgi:hypothetical protein